MGLQSSLIFGDTILVIQNQQIYTPQGIKCGDQYVYDNLRNPLGITLRSFGSLLLGMYSPVIDNPLTSQQQITSRIVTTCGGSPYYGVLSGRTSIFNQFDMVYEAYPPSLPQLTSFTRTVPKEVDYFVL